MGTRIVSPPARRVWSLALIVVVLLGMGGIDPVTVGAVTPQVTPIANPDSYSANTDTPGAHLTVTAPGVLANDYGGTLTAIKMTDPSHGTVALAADGSFTYTPTANYTGPDSFAYKVNNGHADSAATTVTLTVGHINQPPGIAKPGAQTVNQGVALVFSTGSSNAITVSDPDAGTAAIKVTLTVAHGTITATNTVGGTVTVTGSGTASVMLTGPQSQVNTALDGVSYTSAAAYTGAETLAIHADDQGNTGSGGAQTADASVAITVTSSAPVLTAGGTLSYTEGQAATAIDPTITVNDPDSLTLTGATVQITGNYQNGQDVLGFTTQNGITGVFTPATGTLTLSGTTTLANYQTALRSVTYQNTSQSPSAAARTVTWIGNDGTAGSTPVTSTINLTPVNNAPVVTAGGSLTFFAGQGATVIDTTITVSDVDNPNLASATVSITTGFSSADDLLGFTNTVTITGAYSSGTGILTLTGSDTKASYQAALRTVTYNTTTNNPSTATRTVSWVVNDGAADSTGSATSTITVKVNQPPVVTPSNTPLTYTENDPATAINAAITVTDVDSPNLVGATIQITGNFATGQDVLSFTTANGISAAPFDTGTGTLTLSGSSLVANYQTALQNVKYTNTSNDPSALQRTVTWQVNDGAPVNNLSVLKTSTINVTAVNDPPTATNPGTLNAVANIPITFPAGTLSGTDVEAGTTVTVDTTPVSIGTNAAVTINSDGSFTFTPPPDTINSSFVGFSYRVCDNGRPGVACSTPVNVTFNIAGPIIEFVKSVAVGSGNCTLGNECTLSTALANIGANTGREIFISDANTHTASPTLNTGGFLVGQGVAGASFDSVMGVTVPSSGTLATRPNINQSAPTVSGTVTAANTTTVRGLAISSGASSGYVSTGHTGLTVGEVKVTSGNGTAIAVSGTNTGTLAFTAVTVNATSATAISLTGSNSGATFSFTGKLDLTATGGNGFVATGGGTVTATDTTSTIVTTTGTALNVANTTIGAGGLTFRSIDSTTVSGNSGIVLNNTGGSGGLTVTGTGSGGTGGTISNKTVTGISATATANLNLSFMNITSNGNQIDENGIRAVNVTGTSSLTGLSITNSYHANAFFLNDANGTTLTLTVTNSTFNLSQTHDGFHQSATGGAHSTVTVSGCNFNNNFSDGFDGGVADNASLSTTLSDISLTTSNFNDNGANGILIFAAGSGDSKFNIFSNTGISGNPSNGINLFMNNGTLAAGRFRGKVNANTITHTIGLGGFGMMVNTQGAGAAAIEVTNNTVNYNDGSAVAINFQSGDGGPGLTAIKFSGNTVNMNDTGTNDFALGAVRVESGLTAASTRTVCLNAGALTVNLDATNTANGTEKLRVRKRPNSFFNIQGLSPSPSTTAAQVQSYLSSVTGLATSAIFVSGPATYDINYTNATCDTSAASSP